MPFDTLIGRAGELLDSVALVALDRKVLIGAGSIHESSLRALDAIHVAAAIDLSPLDGFISYSDRQSAAARPAGLRTFAPAS